MMAVEEEEPEKKAGSVTTIGLSQEVLNYKPLVQKYAEQCGITEYVDYLLCIMMVESRGQGNDPMQSSESLGLPPNSLMPEQSIEQGVKYFAGLIDKMGRLECDIESAIQSYNYGGGFMDFVAANGKKYSFELAEKFSSDRAGGVKVTYTNPIAVAKNGGWRYNYGNMFYVDLVKQYLIVGVLPDGFGGAVISEALKYQGYPYVFGGTAPQAFDCSSLTQWCYGVAGVNIPRVAQAQYDSMKHISLEEAQPGDLVFFHSTYVTSDYITHVGIYTGNLQMYHAGDPLGYTNLADAYWQAHIVCAGTIR